MSNIIIHHLPPVDHVGAQGKQKEILDVALKQVGFIPNMYANMANAPADTKHVFAWLQFVPQRIRTVTC